MLLNSFVCRRFSLQRFTVHTPSLALRGLGPREFDRRKIHRNVNNDLHETNIASVTFD